MTWTLRLLTPALLLAFACAPKAGETDDEGDLESTGADGTAGGSTTSGDSVTTGDDPTTPPVSGGSADDTASASEPPNPTVDTTTPGTSASSASDTEGSDEVTSVGTFTTTPETTDATATDTEGPDEPPAPCEGAAVDIVAETIVAYNESQVPPQPDPTASGSDTGSTDTGGGNPPETLYVRLSDQQFMCTDPSAILECGPNWEVTIVILPEFQFPGLYDLSGGDGVFAHSGETCAPENNECCFGGGTFDGTFELINITDTTVEGRLCNTQGFFSETDPQLDGTFVAQRCQ